MRPGPKFEITREMAVENVRTVAKRLGVVRLSTRQYEREGSFSVRPIQRKFGWNAVCEEAGLMVNAQCQGMAPRLRKPCTQDCGRLSMAFPRWHLCRTCDRRMKRQAKGMVQCHG
jgi:hypothetical protein